MTDRETKMPPVSIIDQHGGAASFVASTLAPAPVALDDIEAGSGTPRDAGQ